MHSTMDQIMPQLLQTILELLLIKTGVKYKPQHQWKATFD